MEPNKEFQFDLNMVTDLIVLQELRQFDLNEDTITLDELKDSLLND